MERLRGVEPRFSPWQGDALTVVLQPHRTSAVRGIRTPNFSALNGAPLPVGPPRHGSGCRNRTYGFRIQSAVTDASAVPRNESGRRASNPLSQFGRLMCPPSSPRPRGRPYRARTGVLLAENEVSVPSAPTAHETCLPRGSNPESSRASTARCYLAELERHDAWRRRVSNPRPSVCRADALPTELQPHRREYASRTRCVLIPNQARSPCRSFPNAIRCGVLNVRAPPACWGCCAWAAGIEPATTGFGDQRST